MLAALVEYERVRTKGYIPFFKSGSPQLQQLLEMAGIPITRKISRVEFTNGDAKVNTQEVAPAWAVRIGVTICAFLGGHSWQDSLNGHKLVLLLRKARRDKALRQELDAIPKLTDNDKEARDAMQSVLDEIVKTHLMEDVPL